LRELWSDMLISILIANPSKLQFGQEVLHDDLQGLYYDLDDMDPLTPQMKEDIEFQKGYSLSLRNRVILLYLDP
jgi:hypothetical protein